MIQAFNKIKENIEHIKEQMENAARYSGRTLNNVRMIAISKVFPANIVRVAFDCGQRLFGESYTQEALQKQGELSDIPVEWHFVGRIQSNKAKNIIGRFDYIHTVDSIHVAEILHRRLPESILKQKILLQVNIGREPQKAGISIEKLSVAVENILNLSKLELCGFMCLPPICADKKKSAAYFSELRMLRDRLEIQFGFKFPELSMGMSSDYIQAIKEGATFVRIGSGIFGERLPN